VTEEVVASDAVGGEDLAIRARSLETVLELARILAAADGLATLAERAVEAIQRYTGCPGVALFRLDRPRRLFVTLAQRGFDPGRFGQGFTLPYQGSLTGLAAERGRSLSTSDLAADARVDPRAQALLASQGFVHATSVPLQHDGRTVGALNLIYPPDAQVRPEERRILEAMAGVLGLAMAHQDAAAARLALEEQARRAQQLESLGLLAAGIAHDFNNLLVGILGNVDLAREAIDAAGLQEPAAVLAEAVRAADRARSLVRQLLTFARGGAPVKQATASLEELVRDAAGFALRGSSVRYELTVEGPLGTVDLDAGQFAQVVQNLLINGAQHSPSGSVVSIRLARREAPASEGRPAGEAWIELEVADRGRGIPPEALQRIFEPFYSTRAGGTGLGLAVCQSIVARHGGRISVASKVGEGTTFSVRIPAGAAVPCPAAPVAPAPLPRGGRALVMDDEQAVRRVARRMLERAGLEVEEAADGAAALAALGEAGRQGRPFDVAILDVTVPGGQGGLEILPALRRTSSGTRVVLSSGYAGGAHREGTEGVDAWLDKPYSKEQVMAVLGGAWRRRG